jgi:hypothetical protein
VVVGLVPVAEVWRWWVRDVAVRWAVHTPEDGAVPLPPAPPSPGRRW